MPVVFPAEPAAFPGAHRKLWSRAEFGALVKMGIFDQERVELIEGEVISKRGKVRPHVHGVTSVLGWLSNLFGMKFVNFGAPIDVSPVDNPANEPEPDVIVLVRDHRTFTGNPQPNELRLVIEVADSTLYMDLTVKAALYARAGITDYWVVDVQGHRVIVHRSPLSGSYTSVVAYGISEQVAPLAAPDSPLAVRSLFE